MSPPTPGRIDVACLCAAWCRLCDAYAEVLAQVAQDPGLAARTPHWHWIDIEEEAELVGNLDVETFPTLVVAIDGRPWFAGPLAPHAQTLRRLLMPLLGSRSAAIPAAPGGAIDDAEIRALAARLAARPANLIRPA